MRKRQRHDRSKKGRPSRRIVRTIVKDGRERQYHATKGWRDYRMPK